MRIEICDEFFYRICNSKMDLFNKFNSCKENIKRNNNAIKLYNGEWVKVKVNDFIIHHVKPAESLEEISKKYCLDQLKLCEDNNLNNNKLFIGQRLKIYKKF